MIHYKAHETVQRKVTPSESDLEIIRLFALAGEEVNPEDLFIGRQSLANDQYDRSEERFPESYLIQFARTMPGKSVMTGHDYSRDPAGRYFKAEVQVGGGGTGGLVKELVASYYLLASDPLAAKVKAGIARDVSIGFNPDLRLCDLCEKDYDGWMKGQEDACAHVAGKDYEGQKARVTYGGDVEKVEGLEGSFVWLGCQYGAQAIASMRAFSPQAKSAYFDSRGQKGIWSPGMSFNAVYQPPFDLAASNAECAAVIKELSMSETKGQQPPAEAKLTPADQRLIELGKAYIADRQAHVKSRYAPCGQEKTGEVIANLFETASAEEIAAAVKAADEVFNERFPGKGLGVPASDTQEQPLPPRKFNPLRRQLTRI